MIHSKSFLVNSFRFLYLCTSVVILLPFIVLAQQPGQAKPVYPYTHGFLASLNDDEQFACAYAGSDATDKLLRAMSSIPPSGGQLDSFCLAGPQTISQNIWAGFTKNIVWWLGTSTFTVNSNATIPANVMLCPGPGGSIAAGVGFTLTNNSTACFGGGSGGPPTGPAGGDLGGNFPDPIVIGIEGATIPPNQACIGTNGSSQIISGNCTTSPGGSPGQLQWNNAGSFDGLTESIVHHPYGELLLVSSGLATPLFGLYSNNAQPSLASQSNASSTITAIQFQSSVTDNTGSSQQDVGVQIDYNLQGSDVTGDQAIGLNIANVFLGYSAGTPIIIEGINVGSLFDPPGIPANYMLGIQIDNQDPRGDGAPILDAALSIFDQTPGPNVFSIHGGTGLYLLGDWVSPGIDTLANLTTQMATLPTEGYSKLCSDCDTPTYAGALCTSSGDMAGAQATYIQGALYCTGKSLGGGVAGNPAAPSLSLQANNGGVFASIPGSTVDFTTGEVDLSATTSTGAIDALQAKLTITGAAPLGHAITGQVQATGTAAPTYMEAIGAECDNLGSGSISACADYHVRSITNSGGGSLATAVGIDIENQTAGSTSNYAIYSRLGLVSFGDWSSPGTDTLANLTTQMAALPSAGFSKNCSDCDTPTYSGAVCTASGDHAGAQAMFTHGGLYCFSKVLSGASVAFDVNGTPTSNQSLIDFVSGTYITATNPTAGQVKFDITSLPLPTASTLGGIESKTCTSGQFVAEISTSGVPSCDVPAGGGTVQSVGLALPAVFTVTGSPVTVTGTLTAAFTSGEPQNEVLATPNGATGALGLRALVSADFPSALASQTSVNGTPIPASTTIQTVFAHGSITLPTATIAANGGCAVISPITVTGANPATMHGSYATNQDLTGIAGYVPSASGVLTLYPPFVTTNTLTIKNCNNTSNNITPGAVTLLWEVLLP